MWLIDQLADARIDDAIRSGQLDNLAGAGQRISLDEVVVVAEDLRVAYRLLKMSGHLPPQLSMLRELREVERLLSGLAPGEKRSSTVKRLNLLRAQLGSRAESLLHATDDDYASKVINKLDGDAATR